MKQKRKHIFKKLLIFGIAVLLVSCSEDLYDEELNQNKYSLEKVPFSKLKKDKNFNMSFQKSLGLSFKDKLENNYLTSKYESNYIIVDSIAYVASGDNVVSYNFRIEYPNKVALDTIYNLVVEDKSAQNPEYFITKNMKVNQILVPVEITNSNNWSRYTMFDCIIFLASPRDFGEYTMEINWDCVDSAGSNDGNGDSGSGNGNGGLGNGNGGLGNGNGGLGNGSNGSDNSGGSVLVSPIGGNGGADNLTPPNPCKKLKNLFDPSKGNIKPTILNDLRPNIAVNPSGEKGHSLTKNSTGTILGVPILNSSIPVTQVPSGGYFFCALHTHPLDTYPMFSFSDVLTLNNLNNGCASFNQGLASFLLVCQDDNNVFQTYAIVFDPVSVNETIDQFMTNPENIGCTQDEITEKENGKLKIAYNKEYNSLNPNYERVFLRSMFYSNVSLYKANSTLTNWSKLSLSNNSATATVNSTNCN
jgi:hypothetical protein